MADSSEFKDIITRLARVPTPRREDTFPGPDARPKVRFKMEPLAILIGIIWVGKLTYNKLYLPLEISY